VDLDLQETISAAQYYIYSSLPFAANEETLSSFGGLSPGSNARGAEQTDYNGHIFWDMVKDKLFIDLIGNWITFILSIFFLLNVNYKKYDHFLSIKNMIK